MGDENPSVLNSSNELGQSETLENIEEIQCLANCSVSRIQAASVWILKNAERVSEPPIPLLRRKFALSNLDAIEALRAAHALKYLKAL